MPTFLENRAIRRTFFKQALKDLRPLAKANAQRAMDEAHRIASEAHFVRQQIRAQRAAEAEQVD